MPANVALTGTELTRLGQHDQDVPYALYFHKDTVLATADVATTPSGAYTLQIAVTNTANWTKIREGMTAKITSSDASVLRGYYRIRTGGNANALNIEQIAFADPGSIANANRVDIIQQGDKISVLERFDLYSMKPLVIGTTIYQDGAIAVGSQNITPEVVVNITINTYPGDYVTTISSDGGTQAITAVASVTKWPTSSGSTLSYSWITPSSWSSVSGAGSATLTANAPPGDYILYLQVTDSIASVTQEACRWVRICSPGDPPIPCNITSDNDNRQGRKVTIRAVQNRIEAIPPGAKCAVTGPYMWGGQDVATANHTVVGYLWNQPYKHDPNYYESTAEIWGVGYVLDQLMGAPATLKYAGTPVTWEEVAPSLSTVQFAIWWTLRWRCANALKCFNFTDFSYSGTIGRRQNIPIPQGSVYQQIKTLADMYDANVGSRPDGEIIVQQLPSILQDRSGVATRCTLDDSIYSNVSVTWQRRVTVGDVFHSGFYISDDALTADVAVQGEAPGLQTFGQGGKTDKKTNKVYESEVDNEIRVGYWLANDNNEFPTVQVTIPNNWDVFVMADLNRVVVDIPARFSPTGSDISLTCNPVSLTKPWIPGRRASITLTLEVETTGVAGENVPIPPQVSPQPTPINPISALPITPLLPPVPDFGGTVAPPPPVVTPGSLKLALNGDIMTATSAGSVYITPNVIRKHAPDWNNITPGALGSFMPQQVVFDPTGASAGTAIGEYALTINSAGSQSQVQYTPCAALVSPAWTPGTVLTDIYTTMRNNLTPGALLLYGSGQGLTATSVVTFDPGGYAYTIDTNAFNPQASVVSGGNPGNCLSGGTTTVLNSCTPANGVESFAGIEVSLPGPVTVTLVSMDGLLTSPNGFNQLNQNIKLLDAVGGVLASYGGTQTVVAGTWHNVSSGAISVSGVYSIHFDVNECNGAFVGEATFMDNCSVTYTVGAGGGANVVYSSDYGQTFGSALPIGGTAGGGGFDVTRNSGASFAGGFGTVYKATTLGGSYSPYASFGTANPTCIIVPYYRRNSTTLNQTSSGTPDIIVGLDSGTLGLCWLTGGGSAPAGTFNITPAAGFHTSSPHDVTASYGKYLAAVGGGSLWESANGGTSWVHVSFNPGHFLRTRRNDTSALDSRGVLFALDTNGSVNYTSHLVTHLPLYGRVGPEPFTSFDSYP